jgi:hypothetical protein
VTSFLLLSAMTFASAALLAFVVSTCQAQAVHTVQQFAVEASVPVATTIPQAEYYAPLTGKVAARARRQAYKKELVQHLSGTKYVGQLSGAGMDEEYTTPITIGGQKVSSPSLPCLTLLTLGCSSVHSHPRHG